MEKPTKKKRWVSFRGSWGKGGRAEAIDRVLHHGAILPAGLKRIQDLFARCSCRNWIFTVQSEGDRIILKVFHPNPGDPTRFLVGDAHTIPEDAGFDEARQIALAAVEAIGGEAAARDFTFRMP